VRHPTLVVAGEDDPSVPVRNARLLAARLPDARLHVVDGGGHLFLLDEPENVVGPIRNFLDQDEPAPCQAEGAVVDSQPEGVKSKSETGPGCG
jgi:poly(3-hydroxyoctanoate) depolymerase